MTKGAEALFINVMSFRLPHSLVPALERADIDRVLLAENRWPEALERAESALSVAERLAVDPLIPQFRLARANAALGLGQQPNIEDLAVGVDTTSWPVV